MLNRLALVVAVLVVLGTPRMVVANPITYDFTGTLSEPVDGSNALSGSFTFDGTSIQEASAVALTLNLGGQVFNFENNPQDPSSGTVSFSVTQSQPFQEAGEPSVPIAEFELYAISDQVKFVMTDYVRGIDLSNPFAPSFPTLTNLLPGNDATFGFSLSSSEGSDGTVTSMELVSTPEPSAVFIFAGLGVAAMIRRRCGGGWGRRQQA